MAPGRRDFPATFVATEEEIRELTGKSLTGYMKGGAIPEDLVFIEWAPRSKGRYKKLKYDRSAYDPEELDAAFNNSSRCVLSPDGHKLTVSRGDKSFRFDLNEDPCEEKSVDCKCG